MKNKMIGISVIAAFMFAGLNSFASSIKTGSNVFEITPVENLFLGKNVDKVWTVGYSDQKKSVTIILQKNGIKKEFVVRSEFFEVVYIADKSGLGAVKIKNSKREVPKRITSSVLNKQQMQIQRILTPNPVSDEYALVLIASYLPDLLNDGYSHLIY